jgi:5-formyltetrahydrofolate cyclo-ligase
MRSKHTIRAEARVRRTELAAAGRDFAARIAPFAAALGLHGGETIASYWPFNDEADPRGLAAALARSGHPILLPVLGAREMPLTFRLWREGEPLATNAYGIGEPLMQAPVRDPAILLVPLLAFDAEGYRLGYGGGFYDRTLAALRTKAPILVVGIAYAGQERDDLPREPHDQPLDLLVTENGLRRFTRSRE